jgi:hypothetical protein
MANDANLEVPENLPRSLKNDKTQKFVRRLVEKVLSTPETKRSEFSFLYSLSNTNRTNIKQLCIAHGTQPSTGAPG